MNVLFFLISANVVVSVCSLYPLCFQTKGAQYIQIWMYCIAFYIFLIFIKTIVLVFF